MNERRKQYLDNLSKNEKSIRTKINYQKHLLLHYKRMLYYALIQQNFFAIRMYKTIIKLTHCKISHLKRQLPVPLEFVYDGYNPIVMCGVCKNFFQFWTGSGDCCPHCGRKWVYAK